MNTDFRQGVRLSLTKGGHCLFLSDGMQGTFSFASTTSCYTSSVRLTQHIAKHAQPKGNTKNLQFSVLHRLNYQWYRSV